MNHLTTKTGVINGALWLALLLTMGASIQHLAWVFGTVERPGYEWLGWIPAVAVDAGLAALAYTIQQRKKAKRPTAVLWGGVAGFALISALANLYHALAVEGVALAGTWIMYAKAFVLSATLPAMYIFLGEIVSGDDATAARTSEQAAERERGRAERDQRRLDLQAETAALQAKARLLEAERATLQAKAEPEPVAPSEAQAVVCGDCGRGFRSINARNAHKCEGRALAAVAIPLEAPTNGNGNHP
jgi:hypothetical protein